MISGERLPGIYVVLVPQKASSEVVALVTPQRTRDG
jgi:hypothetical protein